MTWHVKKSEWAKAKAAELRAQASKSQFESSGGSWRRAKRKFEGICHLDRQAAEWDRWARYYEHEENCEAWRVLLQRLSAEGRSVAEAVAAGDVEAIRLDALPVDSQPTRPAGRHPGRRLAA
jgi:hypothetical protein